MTDVYGVFGLEYVLQSTFGDVNFRDVYEARENAPCNVINRVPVSEMNDEILPVRRDRHGRVQSINHPDGLSDVDDLLTGMTYQTATTYHDGVGMGYRHATSTRTLTMTLNLKTSLGYNWKYKKTCMETAPERLSRVNDVSGQ